jgi:hypothetical protein
MSLRKYTGLFCSSLIVKTFAMYFSAILEAVKVAELKDANSLETYPCNGLALSETTVGFSLQWYEPILTFATYKQMAYFFTLCKAGIITIEIIWVLKESGKPVMFTKTIDKASGKESFKKTALSFAAWGHKTNDLRKFSQIVAMKDPVSST